MDDADLATKPLSDATKIALIAQYHRMVYKFAIRMSHTSNGVGLGSIEDWYQEGIIGLLDAGEKYDPSRGAKFITFAYRWVWTKMLNSARERGRLIRIPNYLLGNVRWKHSGAADSAVAMVGELPDGLPFRREEFESRHTLDAEKLLRLVPVDHREIVRRKFGIGCPQETLDEIGASLGISDRRTHQIVKAEIKRLRAIAAKGDL